MNYVYIVVYWHLTELSSYYLACLSRLVCSLPTIFDSKWVRQMQCIVMDQVLPGPAPTSSF